MKHLPGGSRTAQILNPRAAEALSDEAQLTAAVIDEIRRLRVEFANFMAGIAGSSERFDYPEPLIGSSNPEPTTTQPPSEQEQQQTFLAAVGVPTYIP